MKNILRPTKAKVILHLGLSLGLVLAIFFLPISRFFGIFSNLSGAQKFLSFSLSWLFIVIVYYPLTASLIYLISSIKNSTYKIKEIILALILIAIFNPFAITYVFSRINIKKNIPVSNVNISQNNNQPTCGLMINEFLPNSKLAEAGINKGDVVLKFNGAEVKIVQDIFDQLAQKKPGDRVALETNKGIKTVELAKDPADPNRPVLGVKLLPNPCENKN